MKIETAIVLPDLQCPFHDEKSLNVVLKYMADNWWDYVIILGDFLDYYSISDFNANYPGVLEGKTILNELATGERVLMKIIKEGRHKNKHCKVIYLEGNHETRAYKFVNRFPHLKGIIEPENALQLKQKGVEYMMSWSHSEMFTIGRANFTHGRYTNDHHAKKMVANYEENIFYGHVHDCNSYNKQAMGTGKTKVGQSLGCLCEYPKEADYTKGAPKNWQQAVTTFYFLPDGNFNYYMTRIFNNRFVAPNGKLYK